MYIPGLDMAFGLDLVVLDPQSGQPVICENKSIYGYMSSSQILGNKTHKGRPKLEHVLQTLIYINEIRTGNVLKQVIASAVADKANNKRNRVRITEDNLALVKDDAQIYGKICYETRDTCETVEFDVEIYEDFDGSHYPQIDGEVWKIFTVESIYERYETLQGYFNRAQGEAVRVLTERGVVRKERRVNTYTSDHSGTLAWGEEEKVIDAEYKRTESEYWTLVGEEMRRLSLEFLPPADYQYRYSDQKIELLASKDLIGQTKYKEWKTWKNGKRRKSGVPIIGDWQCRYCPYKFPCISLEYPDLKSMVMDMLAEEIIEGADAS